MTKVWETKFDTLLNQTTKSIKSVPVRVNYTIGKKRSEKAIDEFDREIIEKINQMSLSGMTTSEIIMGDESSRIENYGITHTHQFYTNRNFIYLLQLFELAKDNVELLSWLTSVSLVTTKMYAFRTDRKGGFMKGTLYIPSYNIELNPSQSLTRKINGFIATDYSTRGDSISSINSATQLYSLPDASINYIFTDPPFGSNIMYSELKSIWESWIKVSTNIIEEAVVSKTQNKSLFEYQTLMNRSLQEYYRVLKPGKWLTMEFSNTSASVWNSIQNALQGVGFIVVNVAALDKKQGSFKAVTTTTAVKQDLVITCYKPSDELTFKFEDALDKASNAMDFIEELLVHLKMAKLLIYLILKMTKMVKCGICVKMEIDVVGVVLNI